MSPPGPHPRAVGVDPTEAAYYMSPGLLVRLAMASSPASPPHPFAHPARAEAVALISVPELVASLEGPHPPLLLDVRPARERRLARLPRDHHVPMAELARRLDELPRHRPIVTYDQYGANARRAAAYLNGHGFPEVAALEGGIDEYARLIDPSIARYPPGGTDAGLMLRQFPRADSGCLAYLVGDLLTQDAVVIDPGREVAPYLQALDEGPWRLVGIVETHTHADHLAGHAALHAKTDAPIFVGRRSPASYPHRTLEEGESVEVGGEAIGVLETPGHTRDHLSLRLRDKVFTGDTLLLGGCGRSDLGDGDPELLYASLHEKLLALPEEVEVFPAHYGPRHALIDRYASTIGFERATNEALQPSSLKAFVRYMTEGWPPKPTNFDRIVRENLTT